MRSTGFLVVALFLSCAAHAQISGYLGKRFSLEADLQSIPTLSGITANNRGLGEHYGTESEKANANFALSWRVGVTASYAISRQRAVTLLTDYLKTGAIVNATSLYYSAANDQYFQDIHYLFYNLEGRTIGIGLRKFNSRKGALPPFGNFRGFTLEATFIKGKIIDKQTTLGGTDLEPRNTHAPLGIQPKTQLFSIGWEFGENYIIADRFLLSFGGHLRLPLQLNALLGDGGEGGGSNQAIFKQSALHRLSVHSLMTIHVGAGFLF